MGPWFHGGSDFHGTVNNRLRLPAVGEKAENQAQAFKGNEERDGRGNVTGGKGRKR